MAFGVTPARVAALMSVAVLLLSPVDGETATVLKLGNVQAPGMPVQIGLRKFAELVRERTKGEVEVQIYPAAQLGSEQEMLESVALGTLHMFEGSAGSVGRFLPQLDAFACPFLWRSKSSLVGVSRGPIGEQLSGELLKKRGMRVLDFGWVFGVRHLTTAKTPVRTPQDMKGLKIRVQPDAIYLAAVRAMGGNPTPIDANEMYNALQTGVVDGQENPISNIWNRKFQEVQKYLILTGHITQNQLIVIGEETYQKLTTAQRDVLVKAAREAGDFQNGIIGEIEQKDLASLKGAGMQVVEPDVEAFRKAAADACRAPAIEKRLGPGFYDKLVAAQP
jgi:tripartite ATP-independent transporter DctP family solute receptor